MDSKTEPASEKEQAIWMANNLLDEPNADPDDDARTISRQFLRALEEITRLKAELERERETVSIREAQQDVMAVDTVRLLDQIEYQNKQSKEDYDKIKKLEFAAQQLSEYKEMIEKLLMIYEDNCLNPNDRFYPKEVHTSTIGKAKKLIEK